MKCPKCDAVCEKYGELTSIGKCPKCGGLFTTKSGGDVMIKRLKVR
jgi:Zn finger protein HypA/HybF involved in hydrogenase expression